MLPLRPRSTRLIQALAALALAMGASQPAALAQATAAPAPSVTAGPDDVMRILPAEELLAAMRRPCHGIKIAAPAWDAQLHASASLLLTLNQIKVPAAQATLPRAMLCPQPSALATAWIRAAEQASNLVKLDFPGAPLQPAGADGKPVSAITGASFIGPQGSRVLLVNQGAQAVRVNLGTWVSKTALLDQYTQQPGAANPPRIRHLQRPLGQQDAQGVLLPPKSLSVVG